MRIRAFCWFSIGVQYSVFGTSFVPIGERAFFDTYAYKLLVHIQGLHMMARINLGKVRQWLSNS